MTELAPPPKPAMEYAVMSPTVTVLCGLCRQPVYDKTDPVVPSAETLMAAVAQHWLRAHTNACPYCWRYVPSSELPAAHRRECAYRFEEVWRHR